MMTNNLFAIIEVDNGLTIVEYGADEDVASVAQANQGILVDAGPFHSFEEAYDQLLNLEPDNDIDRSE